MHNITKERRDELITQSRAICEKAKAEHRGLTSAEQKTIDDYLAEVKGINGALVAEAKSKIILGQLDDMAREAYGTGNSGSAGHLAMTGKHAKSLAAKVIAAMPRDPAFGSKALAAGQQTVSQIMLPDVVPEGRPALSVLDLLPMRTVPAAYVYLRQNNRDLNAAPVAVGAEKPTSPLGVQSITNRLRVVAHLSEPVDHYLLGDNVNLEKFVIDELIWGLRQALETQVLTGTGTGENFTGILNTSGLLVQTFSSDTLTSIRKALTILDGQGYIPAAIVLSAADWEGIELQVATSGAIETRGVPVDSVARRLWGVPVALNQGLGADTGLVISEGAVTLDTDGKIDVRWSDAVGDDFSHNAVRCRVETRAGISVNQPGACVKIATAA